VQNKAGAYAGAKKYGDAANLPAAAMKKRGGASRGGASSPSPRLRGEGPSTGGASATSKIHKPHLDEMHGPESLPYRPGRTPRKPADNDPAPESGSRIFQPTSSREAALGRSTGGAPGHRGGWKKR
jgi:excinuclease ABC subunit B